MDVRLVLFRSVGSWNSLLVMRTLWSSMYVKILRVRIQLSDVFFPSSFTCDVMVASSNWISNALDDLEYDVTCASYHVSSSSQLEMIGFPSSNSGTISFGQGIFT